MEMEMEISWGGNGKFAGIRAGSISRLAAMLRALALQPEPACRLVKD